MFPDRRPCVFYSICIHCVNSAAWINVGFSVLSIFLSSLFDTTQYEAVCVWLCFAPVKMFRFSALYELSPCGRDQPIFCGIPLLAVWKRSRIFGVGNRIIHTKGIASFPPPNADACIEGRNRCFVPRCRWWPSREKKTGVGNGVHLIKRGRVLCNTECKRRGS